jgi:hypothetical protein
MAKTGTCQPNHWRNFSSVANNQSWLQFWINWLTNPQFNQSVALLNSINPKGSIRLDWLIGLRWWCFRASSEHFGSWDDGIKLDFKPSSLINLYSQSELINLPISRGDAYF